MFTQPEIKLDVRYATNWIPICRTFHMLGQFFIHTLLYSIKQNYFCIEIKKKTDIREIDACAQFTIIFLYNKMLY